MLRNALQFATKQIADGNLNAPHPFFEELASRKASFENYLKLDDFLLLGYIDQWAEKDDDLGKLCARLSSTRISKENLAGSVAFFGSSKNTSTGIAELG